MIARYIAFGVLIAAALLAGIWFGEDEMLPSHVSRALHMQSPVVLLVVAVLAPLIAASLGALMFRGKGKTRSAIAAVVIGATLATGYWFGDRELGRALGECPDATGRLRTQLARYRSQNGHYPASLAELGPVPCQRIMRGTLLWYGRTDDSYDLEFGDWLVGWHATPEGMTVTK